MKRRQLLRELIREFNRRKVRYCILRNYEFLLDPREKPGFDLDVSIAEEDRQEAESVLHAHGFIRKPRQFSRRHQGYHSFSTEEMMNIGVDVQWDGVVWNDIEYLGSSIYGRRRKQGWLFTLADEDALIMYLCHSLLGKRFFKEKYARLLRTLAAKRLDECMITGHLSRIFHDERIGERLLALVKRGSFGELLRLRALLIGRFISWRNLPRFLMLSIRWLWEKKVPHAYPLIVLMGPDGAGKSTAVAGLQQVLEKNRRPAAVVYLGRGRRNILPIASAGKKVKRSLAARPLLIRKLIYSCAAPLYTVDLLLRYVLNVWWKRRRRIVLADRYGTDIYLMPHLGSALRSALFTLFPRPALAFYLYNDPQVLYRRRRQQSVEELQRQLALFGAMASKLQAISVKADTKERTMQLVASRTFRYLTLRGF